MENSQKACVQAQSDLLETLFTGPHRLELIASITAGRVRANVTAADHRRFVAALSSLEAHIICASAVQEQGDQEFRLHIQTMAVMLISTSPDAADLLKQYLLHHMEDSEEGNLRMRVILREENGTTCTRDKQIGYVRPSSTA